jgi:hypothetical protein
MKPWIVFPFHPSANDGGVVITFNIYRFHLVNSNPGSSIPVLGVNMMTIIRHQSGETLEQN